MMIALQSAGADRGLLILPQARGYRVEAEARASGAQIEVGLSSATFPESTCPETLLRYVIRTHEGVAFVLDLTERKRAEEALHRAQAELAHVTRVATVDELTALIAHEINQPLGAVVINASACVRWLAAENLEEARQSATRIIMDGYCAAEIIGRIHALAKKAPLQKDWLDLNATIRDVISTSSACSTPSIPRSRTAWAWTWRSAAGSSRHTAAGWGRPPIPHAAPSCSSRCRSAARWWPDGRLKIETAAPSRVAARGWQPHAYVNAARVNYRLGHCQYASKPPLKDPPSPLPCPWTFYGVAAGNDTDSGPKAGGGTRRCEAAS